MESEKISSFLEDWKEARVLVGWRKMLKLVVISFLLPSVISLDIAIHRE